MTCTVLCKWMPTEYRRETVVQSSLNDLYGICKWMPTEYRRETVVQSFCFFVFLMSHFKSSVHSLASEILTIILPFCDSDFHFIPQIYKNHVYEDLLSFHFSCSLEICRQ
jgi:hypothetical protein